VQKKSIKSNQNRSDNVTLVKNFWFVKKSVKESFLFFDGYQFCTASKPLGQYMSVWNEEEPGGHLFPV
jgi:hypothetical protein